MKRKFANYPNWKPVIEKSFVTHYFDEEDFKGYITLLTALKVKEKMIVEREGTEVTLLDNNYKILEFYPESNSHVAMIVAFTAENTIIDWFFDVSEKIGITEEGIPYTDDLYLDILLYPSGKIELVDEEELQQAYDKQIITKEQYEWAYQIANRVMHNITGKVEALTQFTQKYFKRMKEFAKDEKKETNL